MIEQRRDPAAYAGAHLQPYPDRLFEDLPAPQPGPHEVASIREEVGFAFVAAMQLLPPKQRAVLVLRDALDWPAHDVAELLEDTVPAVNSALQRARERMRQEQRAGTLARINAPASTEAEAAVMHRFQEAWAAADIDRIVALLTDDAVLTMPPVGVRVESAAAIGEFFATEPLGGHLERIVLVETRASGQPALACYADEDASGTHGAYGVMVFALHGDRIAGITGFPQDVGLFRQLGAPLCL